MGRPSIQIHGRPIEEVHDIERYDIVLLDRVQGGSYAFFFFFFSNHIQTDVALKHWLCLIYS